MPRNVLHLRQKPVCNMIRNATPADVKAIVNIYNHYIAHSTATFEVDPVDEEEMHRRIAAFSVHCPYLVDEEEGTVAGYCYAHPWKERAAYRGTLETTVYVSPAFQRQGIGRRLMLRLISECRQRGYHTLVACITGGNQASYDLHRSLGFHQVSCFEKVGEKFGQRLDVVDWQLTLVP